MSKDDVHLLMKKMHKAQMTLWTYADSGYQETGWRDDFQSRVDLYELKLDIERILNRCKERTGNHETGCGCSVCITRDNNGDDNGS